MKNNQNTPLIETRSLCKYFKVSSGQLHAVDNINVKIFPEKTLGVVGESGCGKTTLGRTIVQLLKPTSGHVLLQGERIDNLSMRKLRDKRKDIQIIFQDPYSSLDPRMTVSDIIAEYMIINKTYKHKADIYKKVSELMDIVGLARRLSESYPHELDGGRLQRVGIARTLSLNPKFIVCDEPVSALDVSIQAQILNLLMDLQDEMGLTYMFVTHDLSVIKHISNEIMVMYLGQCVEMATTDELFANPLHPYTQKLLSAIPIPDISMRTKKIEVIKGEVTSPINPKPGCRFAPRCDFATDRCLGKDPDLITVNENHKVACVLREKMG